MYLIIKFKIIKYFLFINSIWLYLLLITFQVSAQVTRQPYLQDVTPYSVVIRWQTGNNIKGEVYFGESISILNFKAYEALKETTNHLVKITGLMPGTKYYYSVESSSDLDSSRYFITSPSAGSKKSVRIWAISDFGQRDSHQNNRRLETVNVWKEFNHNNYHADFILSLGDQTEDDSLNQLQNNYFNMLENVLRNSSLYTVVGNHDIHDHLLNYLNTFTLPENGEAGGIPSGSQLFYSFNYLNIHVIVLCTESSNKNFRKEQTDWLKKDLAANKQEWLIACVHRPFYSGGYHATDETKVAQEMRNAWLPILYDYNVDLILQGHNHDYERSFLIYGLTGKTTSLTNSNILNKGLGREDQGGPYVKKKSLPHQGTIFMEVTAGGDANPVKRFVHYSIFPVYYAGKNFEGSVVIDVNGNRMDVKFLCDEKNDKSSHIWDYFTIVKKD